MKNKSNIPNTPEGIEALRVMLKTAEENLAKKNAEEAATKTTKLSTLLGGLPKSVSAIMGREVTAAEVIGFMRRQEAGTLGSLANVKTVNVNTGTNHGQHAKRLTADEEAKVRAFYIAREVKVKQNQPAPTISAFTTAMNISGQTYDARRKKFVADAAVQAEVAELIAKEVAPAQAPAPASVAV